MKSVKCVNENGLSAVFTYDHDSTEYFLVSLDGVYLSLIHIYQSRS